MGCLKLHTGTNETPLKIAYRKKNKRTVPKYYQKKEDVQTEMQTQTGTNKQSTGEAKDNKQFRSARKAAKKKEKK